MRRGTLWTVHTAAHSGVLKQINWQIKNTGKKITKKRLGTFQMQMSYIHTCMKNRVRTPSAK